MYLVPKKALHNQATLDNQDFNDFLQEASNRVQGELGEHNFETGAALSQNVADGAYYSHSLSNFNVDPDFLGSLTPLPGGLGPDAAYTVSNDKQWGSTGAQSTVTTEDSWLWCAALVQYTYHDWIKSGNIPTDRASVQFAIRVDGQVYETSIPGKKEETIADWAPFTVSSPKSDASYIGARVFRYDTAHSLGAQHRPVRIGALVRVTPGEHLVELVARRVDMSSRIGFLSASDYVECLTRKLYTLEIPLMPQSSATAAPSVDCDYIEDNTVLSKASYETNRLDNIIAAYSSLDVGNLGRGALNHNHIPSAVFASRQTYLDPAGSSCSNEYPGFALATLGDPGWYQLTDGVDVLETSGTLVFTAYEDCWLIVMADIEVSTIGCAAGDIESNFGMFCFMAYYGGAWNVLGAGETEVHLNEHIINTTESSIHYCVSMLYVEHLAAPIADWAKIGVFASTWNGSGLSVTMRWGSASLKVLVLRP